jgi:hypothetical protein
MEVNVDSTLKLASICKFSPDNRHVPDHGSKKVIMPTFMSLRQNEWFNDHSLTSKDISSFVISGRDFIKGEGCNTLSVTVASMSQSKFTVEPKLSGFKFKFCLFGFSSLSHICYL